MSNPYKKIENLINTTISKVRDLRDLAKVEGTAVDYNQGRIKVIEDTLFELRETYRVYSSCSVDQVLTKEDTTQEEGEE